MFKPKWLNRKGDGDKSPTRSQTLLSTSNDGGVENEGSSSAEGFLCPTCYVQFPTAEELKNHDESAHANNIACMTNCKVVCLICKMKFLTEDDCMSHTERHHTIDDNELEILKNQLLAVAEGKSLLQKELEVARTEALEHLKEKATILEDRDILELKVAKLTAETSNLKADLDELLTKKKSLELFAKESEEKIVVLELEIQQRPEADDVKVLKQEIVSVQKMMDNMTLQREAEKLAVDLECVKLQAKCDKLTAELEKSTLESSHLSDTLVQKNKELEELTAKQKASQIHLQDAELLSQERLEMVQKLQNDLETEKTEVEQLKLDRDELFAKIEEGEGTNAVVEQVMQENGRIKMQMTLEKNELMKLLEANSKEYSSTREKLLKEICDLQEQLEFEKDRCASIESSCSKEIALKGEGCAKEIDRMKSLLKDNQKELHLAKKSRDEVTAKFSIVKEHINELKKTIESMHEQILSADEKVQKFSTMIQELQEVKQSNIEYMSKLEREVKGLETKCDELNQTIKVKDANYAKLSLQFTTMSTETESLRGKMNEMNREIMDIQAMKEDCENKVKEVSEELTKYRTKVQELDKELESTCHEKAMLIGEYTEKVESIKKKFSSDCETVNEQLKEKIQCCEYLNASMEDLREQCSKEKSQLEDVNKKLGENVKGYCQKIQELESVVHMQELAQAHAFENSEKLKNSLTDSHDTISKLEHQLLSQNKLLDDKDKDLLSRKSELENMKDILVGEKLTFVKELDKIREKYEKEVAHLTKNGDEMKNNIKALEAELQNMSTKYTNSEKEAIEMKEEYEKSCSEYKAQIGVLSLNVSTLREDLDSEQKRRERVAQEFDDMCGAKLELDAKHDNVVRERRALLDRCLKSECENEKLLVSNAELRRKLDGSTAALHELGLENQSLQMENMKHQGRKWADDSEVSNCTACGKVFSVTVRKHHCRNCGNIFCNDCSARTATVASSKKPVRVCDVCFSDLGK